MIVKEATHSTEKKKNRSIAQHANNRLRKFHTLSGHHCKSSPKETGLWTGVFFLSRFGSPSLLVEPLSLSNEAPSSHLRSRKRKTDSRSRNSSESLSKGRRRTGMQLGHTSGIKVSHSLVKTLQDATNSS